jgi:EAL domain-containing protein (putative c-di-GMP-specific phosphodiesterase class I)
MMRLIAIDDEPIMLRLVELLAAQSGIESRTTTNPDEFLSLARDWPPDFVLVDLQMPNLDGLEVLRALAELRTKASVILMSAFEPKVLQVVRSIGESFGLTMGETLQKPITATNFARSLAQPTSARTITRIDALSLAIDRGELTLHWQPIIDLESNRITGMEALCRWQHPDQGLIYPDAFIPLAETSGMSQRLSAWVLNNAFAQAAEWKRCGATPRVAINISPEAFEATEFVELLEALRIEHGLASNQICLELTESSAARHPTRLRESITRLRLRNYHVALDDFGTGTSTLQQIQALPCTELKIDKSFVLQMAYSEEASAIVRSILALASALDVKVIAEGIESEEIARLLQQGGCQMGQGYFFARPMPADRATELLCSEN